MLKNYKYKYRSCLFKTCVMQALFLASALAGVGAGAQTGSTTSFNIDIPKRGSGTGSKAIYQVEATIVMEGTGTVNFLVTDPEGETQDFSLDASTVCSGNDPVTNPCLAEFPDPGTGSGGDAVTWELPGAPDDDDPENVIYKLTINPFSNTADSPGGCADTMPVATETFTIEVLSGPQITGVCLISYDLTAPGAECDNIGPPIQSPPLATIDAGSGEEQFCQQLRPGVDSTLVLDKSGSMNSPPMAGPSARKIDALKSAVNTFVERWGDIRGAEGSPPNDNIGVVLFDGNASWLGGATGLAGFDTVAPSIAGDMALVNATGTTSIGDGLFTASNALFAGSRSSNGNRKTILLMSDGKQNTHRRVRLWKDGSVLQWSDVTAGMPPTDIDIEVGSDSDGWNKLPNEDSLRIYAVTVGSSAAVGAEINQGLAMATGGFYINTETTASSLSAFFIEVLQNFVKFNTWNTVALRSAEVGIAEGASQPYSIDFPLPSTSRAVSVDLAWNPEFGHVCLDVLPPGADKPKTVCSDWEAREAGKLSWSENFLKAGNSYDSTAKWRVTIRPDSGVQPIGVAATYDEAPIDRRFSVSLIIMSEDTNVASDFTIETGDYVPGSQIPLRVSLKESGRALLKDMTVSARVASPSQSIGDLLSASNASTSQPDNCPGGCDIESAANAKLVNELEKNEDALQSDFDTITFVDNGDANNGDLIAGDGVYSALYQVSVPGHYNVLFNSVGSTERSGDVQREQLMSLVVRNQPDPGQTSIDSDISIDPDSNQQSLNVTFKPATQGGNLMGPGWGNYFWFTGPGITPFKAIDKLDGTYSATVNFTDEAPKLTLHFLDVAQVIEDSVTGDTLPIPLEEGTAIGIVVPDNGNGACQWYDLTCGTIWLKYLILIIILLLILLLLFRRSSSNP